MKKICIPFALLLVLSSFGFAQNKITVNATVGEDLTNALATSRLLFPDFLTADVYLSKGTTSRAKMNYDMYTDEMMFISNKDTMVLVSDVETIVFEEHPFRYTSKGFAEVIAYNPDASSELLLKRSLRKTAERKDGGYGKTPVSASATSFTNVSQEASVSSLSISSDVTFKRDYTYYIRLKGKSRIADKSGFLKSYPKKKEQITEYLQQNEIDFDKGENVLRLYIFCEE